MQLKQLTFRFRELLNLLGVLAREENRQYCNREKPFLTAAQKKRRTSRKNARPCSLKIVKINRACLLGVIYLLLVSLSRRSTPAALALVSKFLMYQAEMLRMATEMKVPGRCPFSIKALSILLSMRPF